ncbi:hypothetical protein BU16DRAFT_545203 [Lophium mytilinum]|uniref:Uncharacterized protein n=1 Tax=Lophium mytilinum TaxID=390894 RepID=A0A6A6Q9Q6_9PEZI|nr:hypothetical protein BU16DRAFT_545203 [Lophium mytilinum]
MGRKCTSELEDEVTYSRPTTGRYCAPYFKDPFVNNRWCLTCDDLKPTAEFSRLTKRYIYKSSCNRRIKFRAAQQWVSLTKPCTSPYCSGRIADNHSSSTFRTYKDRDSDCEIDKKEDRVEIRPCPLITLEGLRNRLTTPPPAPSRAAPQTPLRAASPQVLIPIPKRRGESPATPARIPKR